MRDSVRHGRIRNFLLICHRFDNLESFFWQRPDFSIIPQKPLPSAQNLPEGENRTGNKG
jgi:hypothetical protein